MRYLRRLIYVFGLLLLTGCMGIKFTYNNLDWIVPWYMDDFISLSKEQELMFEQEFESLWLWHRKEELPKYVTALESLKKDIADDTISMEKIRDYRVQSTILYRTVAKRAINQSLGLMGTLTDEQIAEITTLIEEEAEEFEEYLAENSAEDRVKKTKRRAEKQFRKWLGELTKKQKRLIAQWSDDVESTTEFRLNYFKRSRTAFLESLNYRDDPEELGKRLIFLVDERDSLHTKEHIETRERNAERMSNLMLELNASLTKKQKKRLLRKISSYQESFAELVEEAEAD